MSNSESVNTVDDIEVYVRKLPLATICDWLDTTFDAVTSINSGRVVHDLQVTLAGTNHSGNDC